MEGERETVRGFAAQTLGASGQSLGVRHVVLHYSADPTKTPDWVAGMRARMASQGRGDRDWDREMELREDVYEGQPVFEMYDNKVHAPEKYAEGIPVLSGSVLIGGWDCGQTLQPAFCLVQVTEKPYQVHSLLEVISDGGESMEEFAPRVFAQMVRHVPGRWDEAQHVGDATVVNRSGSDGRSAQMIAKQHGFHIKPMSNAWQQRWSSVTWLLNRQLEERTPGFMLSSRMCPTLHQGFLGAYQLDERRDREGNVRDLLQPVKNKYSHVQDALQYSALAVRKLIGGAAGARLQREGDG